MGDLVYVLPILGSGLGAIGVIVASLLKPNNRGIAKMFGTVLAVCLIAVAIDLFINFLAVLSFSEGPFALAAFWAVFSAVISFVIAGIFVHKAALNGGGENKEKTVQIDQG